ncbi:MAG TPA: Hpt domain-containing protein [Acidobacteriaceae bacterium]|nr:Hpt domain-containing protein [Acidobacteriaceae bacterium]
MSDPAAALASKLSELWKVSRPVILDRMAALHAAHASLSANLADAQARREGREVAHKLAGVLGTFGLGEGSVIASSIESVLMADTPLTAADLSALGTQIAELDSVIASKA